MVNIPPAPAGGIGPRRAGSGPNACTDRGSLPTAGERPNEGAGPGASTNKREVSLRMALTLGGDGTGLNIDPLPALHLNGSEGQSQISGILQPARLLCRDHTASHSRALGKKSLSLDYDGSCKLRIELFTWLRGSAAYGLKQPHREGRPARHSHGARQNAREQSGVLLCRCGAPARICRDRV